MKKGFLAIITTVAILTVFLVVLAYGTLETVSVPDSIISYKANYIEFKNFVTGSVLPNDPATFSRDSYAFVTDSTANQIWDKAYADYEGPYIEGMFIPVQVDLKRYRENVYDVGSSVQYDVGVPIYANIAIKRQVVPNGYAYILRLDGYYIEFSFEQFAYNATYTLDYQAYMRDNSPSLQPVSKPDYSADNTFDAVRHFFSYVGDSINHMFVKLQWLANYPTFYVQDYAVLFKL